MNKKQVNALLKVMSKDAMRPVLRNAYIDEYEGRTVLVATDGYMLTALNIEIDAEHIGKSIKREAIEVWCKLATGRSRFGGEAIAELAGNKANLSDLEYPKWQGLIDRKQSAQDMMRFNADYAKTLQDLSGEDGLAWKLHGKISPMIARTENGTYVMMPMKQ